MTRLEANVKDFHLDRQGNAVKAYRFRFGHCEDFADALQQFKRRIPLEERIPQPESAWLWEVTATPQNRNALAQIFDNFEECVTIAEAQLRLWE